MGADRKGPLAAFVIVAVIAAILLITSVRSQAAPGWSPLSTVAASPASNGLWGSVRDGVDAAVGHGAVLVRAVAQEATSGDESTTPTARAATPAAAGAPAHASSPATTASHGHRRAAPSPSVPPAAAAPPSAGGHPHGHHPAPPGGHAPAHGHAGHVPGTPQGHGRHHDHGRHLGQQRVLRS